MLKSLQLLGLNFRPQQKPWKRSMNAWHRVIHLRIFYLKVYVVKSLKILSGTVSFYSSLNCNWCTNYENVHKWKIKKDADDNTYRWDST